MQSNRSYTLGGEGWPAADVAEAFKNRKSSNAALQVRAGASPEQTGALQKNWHRFDTALFTTRSAVVALALLLTTTIEIRGSHARGLADPRAHTERVSMEVVNLPAVIAPSDRTLSLLIQHYKTDPQINSRGIPNRSPDGRRVAGRQLCQDCRPATSLAVAA